MEIRDVVGQLRESQLQLQLRVSSLQSQVSQLERFTWNLIKLIKIGGVEIPVDELLEKTEKTDADPTLF